MNKCEADGCPNSVKKYGRRFCSVKCRASSSDFKTMIAKHSHLARETRAEYRTPAMRSCEGCGAEFECQPKRKTRFHSRACYRAWLAKLFDGQMDTHATINGLSGYDEFLSQDQLYCLIDGCDWHGDDLSHHVLMSHGILAKDFKERAGFNNGTGLIGRKLSETLSKRTRGLGIFTERGFGPQKGCGTLRAEGAEHHQKAMAIINQGVQTK